MHNYVVKASYDSPTDAAIKGFELLIETAECWQFVAAAAQIMARTLI